MAQLLVLAAQKNHFRIVLHTHLQHLHIVIQAVLQRLPQLALRGWEAGRELAPEATDLGIRYLNQIDRIENAARFVLVHLLVHLGGEEVHGVQAEGWLHDKVVIVALLGRLLALGQKGFPSGPMLRLVLLPQRGLQTIGLLILHEDLGTLVLR